MKFDICKPSISSMASSGVSVVTQQSDVAFFCSLYKDGEESPSLIHDLVRVVVGGLTSHKVI